jgi:cell division protein FtsI/penicillin-binding protein 2
MNFRTLVLGALLLAPSAHAQAQAPAAPEAAAEDTRALRLFVAGRDAWLADAAKSSDGTTKAELEERAARLSKVLAEASDLRAQVLIGELVERDGKPVLVQHSWRADAQYFYPASTVKLLAAVAALERMRELQRGPAPKLDADTPLAFWPPRRGGAIVAQDSDNVTDGKLTLRHLVREALVVSDNESFNRLYEFTGHDRLNKLMWDAGLESVRITHRLNV